MACRYNLSHGTSVSVLPSTLLFGVLNGGVSITGLVWLIQTLETAYNFRQRIKGRVFYIHTQWKKQVVYIQVGQVVR